MNETKKRFPTFGAVVVIGGMLAILYGLIHLNVLIDFVNYLSEILF